MGRKVIQVPMDDELLAALEVYSRKRGRSRAEVIREACLSYLRRLEEEQLEKVYQDGYVRLPEAPTLGETQVSLAGQVLPDEEW